MLMLAAAALCDPDAQPSPSSSSHLFPPPPPPPSAASNLLLLPSAIIKTDFDYFPHHQDHDDDEDDDDSDLRRRAKRSRLSSSAAAAAAAVVAASSSSPPPDQPLPPPPPPQPQHHHRRLWVKERSQAWWERCLSPDFSDHDFRQSFRMSRRTFELICDELSSAVAKEDTMLRQAIPVRQRVAVCIWRLATGEPLRLVSKRFGLGISTCHKLVLEVCAAMNGVLLAKYVQWPSSPAAASATAARFAAISGGIPSVVGAIYTTHIPIIAPKSNITAYYNKRHSERNQKTSYTLTLQGVVDAGGAFTDVCIGWPGSLSDAQVLEKSALYRRGLAALPDDGVWVVGGASFPLLDWLLVPYSPAHLHLNWAQHAFNEKADAISAVARAAFARLKGRWRFLQRRAEVKLQELPTILGACVVLHNICEMYGEEFVPEPSVVQLSEVDDQQPPLAAPIPSSSAAWPSQNAILRREEIAHNLLHHNAAVPAPAPPPFV